MCLRDYDNGISRNIPMTRSTSSSPCKVVEDTYGFMSNLVPQRADYNVMTDVLHAARLGKLHITRVLHAPRLSGNRGVKVLITVGRYTILIEAIVLEDDSGHGEIPSRTSTYEQDEFSLIVFGESAFSQKRDIGKDVPSAIYNAITGHDPDMQEEGCVQLSECV
ncbi:hypothetical protein BKA93DRAFT_753836 [Sparassis latifolia]